MAQTYEVGLRYTGSDAASRALRDADAIDAAMSKIERRRGGTALFKGADWAKTAQMASRAAERERTMQLRMEAEAIRSAQRMEDQKRNAAFRRLQAQQREEERFTQYKIRLIKREAAEQERLRKQQRAARDARGESIASRAKGGALAVGAAATGGLLAGGAYILKEAFDTTKQIEQARNRMTALLGSRERATRDIKDLVRASSKTALDWQDLVNASSSLTTILPDDEERRYVVASLSDLVAGSGGGKDDMKRLVIALTQIEGKSKLQAQEFNQITEPLKGLVGQKEMYRELAKMMGISAKDDKELQAKMRKIQEDGQIESRAAIAAVTVVGRRKLGSQKAGDYAVKEGDIIAGQISNIKTGFSTLFALADTDEWSSFLALRDVLKVVSDFFSVDGEQGQAFIQKIKESFDALTPQIEWFGRQLKRFLSNPKAIDLMIKGVVGIGQAFFYTGLVVFMAVSGIVMGIGLIKDAFTWVVDGASDLIDSIVDAVSGSIDRMYELGANIGQGLANGIRGAKDAVVGAVKDTAKSVLLNTADALEIRSPSRKMMALGRYAGEGLALGLDQSEKGISDASMNLSNAIGIKGSGSISGSASSGGGSPVFNTYVTLTGSDVANSEDAAKLIGARIEAQIDRYFGRLVSQGA